MKNVKIITTLVYALMTLNLAAQGPTDIPGGEVSGTWVKVNSPYRILGDIEIAAGEILTIQPGVVVEFTGHHELTIHGQIFAMGAESDTIVFTINDPSGFDTDLNDTIGSWNGINFRNTADTSKFYYCKFQYAKALDLDPDDYSDDEGGAFYSIGGVKKLIISRSHFYYNYAIDGGAMGTRAAEFLVEECRFSYNRAIYWGGAVYGGDGKLKMNNNYFAYNTCENNGGAIGFWGGSQYKFYGNHFVSNSAQHGGAIYANASTFTLINNILANNYCSTSGGAIFCNNTAYPRLTGNLIVNNTAGSWGGGLYLSQTNALLYNNTIANNSSTNGGGLFSGNSTPEIQNSIIHGNSPNQVYISTSLSSPDIYHSNLEGGEGSIAGSTFNGVYESCIDEDPLFEDPTTVSGTGQDGYSADWALKPSSPSLNGGNPEVYALNLPEKDVYDNMRIRNNIVDMGAAETHVSVTKINADITTDQYWFSDTVKIMKSIAIVDGVTLTINAGTVVEFQGYYEMSVQGVLIAQGSKDKLIRFTVPEENQTTGWEGIDIDNQGGSMLDNAPSLIDYCLIEYAKKISGGGIEVSYFDNLTVSNSIFRYDSADYRGAAIHVYHCSPLIKDNLFYDNHADRGVIAASYGSPSIIGNTIINNTHSELVGGVFGWWSNFVLQDNFIANNEGGFYSFASNTKEYVLINNIIVNNSSFAIQASGINVYAMNNTVVNNDGHGIYANQSDLTLINNIFRGNEYNSVNQFDNPSENTVKIVNCNIEGGIASMINLDAPNMVYSDMIDREPYFINPTPGSGISYESVPADWKLLSISPNIDAGLTDDFPYSLPAYDLLDQNRINNELVDIGAIENQSGPVEILVNPVGGIKCSGDSIRFSVELNDTAFYQWLKDGVVIPGANTSYLDINDLTAWNEGNYSCRVNNSYGSVTSSSVLLVVKSPPALLTEPESEWIPKGIDMNLAITAEGTPPVRFQWFKNGDSITDASKPVLRFMSTDYSHEGEYFCRITNVCGEVESTPAVLYVAPEICMVTIDTATGNNLVVWEKQSSAPIESYNIYREGIIAGFYDLIGTVPYDELSIFVDTAANPEVQAYWYKITAVDNLDVESDINLCTPHKTIHLLTTVNPETGATQLDWDSYIGFEYGTFHILRSAQESSFSIYHSMASSTNTWTDLDPGQALYYYRIAVEKPGLCSPAGGKKASAGPYSHSMSNVEDNRLQTGLNQIKAEALTVYPNPFSDRTTIRFPNANGSEYTLIIRNLSGRTVRIIDNITTSEIELDGDGFAKGYYLIELRGEKTCMGRVIVK